MKSKAFVYGIYLGNFATYKGDIPICVDSKKGGFTLLYDAHSKIDAISYLETIILTLLDAQDLNRYKVLLLSNSQFNYLPELDKLDIIGQIENKQDIEKKLNKIYKIIEERSFLLDSKTATISDYNCKSDTIKPYYIVFLDLNSVLEYISSKELQELIKLSFNCGIYFIFGATIESTTTKEMAEAIRIFPMMAIDKGKFIPSDEIIKCTKMFENFTIDIDDREYLVQKIYQKAYKQMPSSTLTDIQKLKIHKRSKEKIENGIYNLSYKRALEKFKNYKEYQLAIFKHFKFEKSIEAIDSWLEELDIRINGNILEFKELSLNNKKLSSLPKELVLLENLQYIDLSFNNFSSIEPIISKLENLKEIDLEHNQIEKIENLNSNLVSINLADNKITDFSNLKSLKFVNLANNKISKLPSNIEEFELRYLDLSNNELKIDDNFAKINPNTELILDGNPIYSMPKNKNFPTNVVNAIIKAIDKNEEKDWQEALKIGSKDAYLAYLLKYENPKYKDLIDKKILEEIEFELNLTEFIEWVNRYSIDIDINNIKNIKELDLSSKSISQIPDAIKILQNLEVLNLSNNSLKELPEVIGLMQNLKELHIGSNSLSFLPTSFANLKNLEVLSLWNNSFKIFPQEISSLKNLKKLNIAKNEIEQVDSSLSQLINLEVLDLSYNKLKSFDIISIHLKKLKTLYLSFNEFVEFPKQTTNLQNLKTLYLDNNSLEFIDESVNRLNNLKELNLSHNKLTTTKNIDKLAPNVEHIELVNNKLTSLEDTQKLNYLENLNIKFNKLQKLDNKFTKLKKIKILNISNNKLKTLTPYFGDLKSLEKLYLSNNKLSKLPDSFTDLVNLKELDLRDNPLNELPEHLENLKDTIIRHLKDLVYKNDNELWQKCKVVDSKEAYKIYLKNFPNGVHSLEAKEALKNKGFFLFKLFNKMF